MTIRPVTEDDLELLKAVLYEAAEIGEVMSRGCERGSWSKLVGAAGIEPATYSV